VRAEGDVGYPFADQTNGGSIKGMLEAVDLFDQVAGPDTILVPGHGILIKKGEIAPYRAMLVDIMARVTALRNQGKTLKEVLAANLTAAYDKTTLGDTQRSKERFITEAYDEVRDFPPIVDGKRTTCVAHVRAAAGNLSSIVRIVGGGIVESNVIPS
jgi:hypothetical protein